MAPLCGLTFLCLLACAVPPTAAGQDVATLDDRPAPTWLRAWSPFLGTAELGRVPPVMNLAIPDPATWPAPQVGLFWSAGNPGALPADVTDAYSSLSSGFSQETGGYRRPLDPARSTSRFANGIGWRPLGEHGAAVGRIRVASRQHTVALSDNDDPYAGSPYVVMDTAGSNLARTEVELEGGAGWRVGRLGFGLTLAYRGLSSRTREAPVPRTMSSADPAALVGATWQISPRLTLGVHGRWRSHAERLSIYTVAASSRVYRLQGYFEPPPQDLSSGFYSRRVERDGYAGSVSMGGRTASLRWAVFAELGTQEERQFVPGRSSIGADRWDTAARTVGAALVRGLGSPRHYVATSVRYSRLNGDAARGDLTDTTTFVTNDAVFHGEMEIGLSAAEDIHFVGKAVIRHEDRSRRDQLEHVGSSIQSWTIGLGIAAVVAVSDRLRIAPAIAGGAYRAGGMVPDGADIGEAFQRYVQPALALESADASDWLAAVTGVLTLSDRTNLWIRGAWGRTTPDIRHLDEFGPTGERSRWAFEVGVVLGPDGEGPR